MTTSAVISVTEYYQAGEKYTNTELIHGQVIPMSPIGAKHAVLVAYLGEILTEQIVQNFRGILHLRTQNPVRLNNFSEPQPDITIVKGHPSKYYQQHPEPNDIILIIEVADATINYDLSVKVPLYASVNIPEVWVVDINSEQCLVHRQPKNHIYEQIIICNSSETLTLPTYPQLHIELSLLFSLRGKSSGL